MQKQKPANYAAFSGGKDSTALALIEPDAQPVFTDTQWEFPEIYAHIARFEEATGRAVTRIRHPLWPGGLPEYIRHARYAPSPRARFCTRIFKIEAWNLWTLGIENRDHYGAYREERRRLNVIRRRERQPTPALDADLDAAIAAGLTPRVPCTLMIGLRADEPPSMRIGNTTDLSGMAIAYPLRERGMRLMDVLRVCLDADLLPRYPVYMARGGCTGCFYKCKSEVFAMAALAPDVMDALQQLEEEIQDERGRYYHLFGSTGMSIAELRRLPQMFSPDEVYASAADTSEMGAVCGLFCNR